MNGGHVVVKTFIVLGNAWLDRNLYLQWNMGSNLPWLIWKVLWMRA